MRSRSKTPAGSDRSSGILETASETLSPAGLGAARVINTAPISPIQPSIHPSAHHLSLFLSLLSVAMYTIAPRAAAPGFGATAFLDRQRGVVAAVAPTATSGHNAGEPTRLIARASEVSTATARKRGRHDGFEHVVVDPAASSALRIRMDAELVALQGLLKRAKLLPRSAPPRREQVRTAATTIGGACGVVGSKEDDVVATQGSNGGGGGVSSDSDHGTSSEFKATAAPSGQEPDRSGSSQQAAAAATSRDSSSSEAAAAPGPACSGGQDGSSEEAATGGGEGACARSRKGAVPADAAGDGEVGAAR